MHREILDSEAGVIAQGPPRRGSSLRCREGLGIAISTVRRTLKNGFSEESWVIPPEADAEFVSHQVLETYANPPEHPVMDEQPPIKETRTPIPADHPQCVDYEHERAGTASIFMEALSPFNDN